MIHFTKKQDNLFIEGITEKGNIIYYAQSLLNCYDTERSIVIYSNISFTKEMKIMIGQSNVLKIDSFCNYDQQFTARLLPEFNYDKLETLLKEIVETFKL